MGENLAFIQNGGTGSPVKGMEETITTIKAKFAAAKEQELAKLILLYQKDDRVGVLQEIQRAEKRIQKWEQEKKRTASLWEYEKRYCAYTHICGIDEAGRGPLAGPVVAGAVILPKDCEILYIDDSKKLSEKKREELYTQIMDQALATGIGMAGPRRIDEINILQATYEAMREAISKLAVLPDILLNDAVTIPEVSCPQIPIIKGDAKSISIAAASILAKVTRDRLMAGYHKDYPEYGFASNKGYGSASHIEALKKYGPTPIHRQSFIKHFTD